MICVQNRDLVVLCLPADFLGLFKNCQIVKLKKSQKVSSSERVKYVNSMDASCAVCQPPYNERVRKGKQSKLKEF